MESLQATRGKLMEVLHQARAELAGGADVRLCRLVGASSIDDGTASGGTARA